MQNVKSCSYLPSGLPHGWGLSTVSQLSEKENLLREFIMLECYGHKLIQFSLKYKARDKLFFEALLFSSFFFFYTALSLPCQFCSNPQLKDKRKMHLLLRGLFFFFSKMAPIISRQKKKLDCTIFR